MSKLVSILVAAVFVSMPAFSFAADAPKKDVKAEATQNKPVEKGATEKLGPKSKQPRLSDMKPGQCRWIPIDMMGDGCVWCLQPDGKMKESC